MDVQNINWESINNDTPEGQLLKTAICLLCCIRFKDKNPGMVLELVKDLRANIFIDESFEQTFERLEQKFKEKYN